jgi:tetratricopeptide (TPR) repeat protein
MSGRFCLILVALVVFSASGCGGGGGKKELSFEQQLKKANAIADEGLKAKQLATIGEKQVKAGDVLAGESTLNGAGDTATKIEDPSKRADALIFVGKAMANAGKTNEAKKMIREAGKALDKVEDPDRKARALAKLGEAAAVQLNNPDAAAEHLKNAEAAAAKIEDAVTRASAYGDILIAYERGKQPAEADKIKTQLEEYAKSLETPRKQVDCLAELGDALSKAKKTDEATAVFGDASKIAEDIKEDEARGYAYLNLAKKLKQSGRPDEARKSLSKADDAARKVTDSSVRQTLTDDIQAASK